MRRTTIATDVPLQSSHTFVWEVAMLCLFPLAVFAFGTVHPWPRMVLAVAATLVGWQMWRSGHYSTHPLHRSLAAMGVLAIALSALAFLPVSAEWRQALQPGVAEPVTAVLAIVDAGARPLALDPWHGLIEWSLGAALLLLGWGAAGRVSRASRGWTLLWVFVGTGVALVGLAMVQRSEGATAIYWVSGVPDRLREPFFGAYINANHGGALCAALIPLALSASAIGPFRSRGIGVVCLSILAVGVFSAGSRGALLAAGVGAAIPLLIAGTRWVRLSTGLLVGGAVTWAVMVGPDAAIRGVGSLVAPEVGAMVDAGYVDLTTGRRELLIDVWELAKGVWVLGVGPGGFDDAFRIAKTSPAFNITTHAHNEVLQLWVEHGLVVAGLWVAVVLGLVWVAIAGARRWVSRPDRQWLIGGFVGSLGALGLFAMVDFPMRLGSHGVLVALAGGAAVGLSRKPGRGQRPGPVWWWSMTALAAGVVLSAGVVWVGEKDPSFPVGSADAAMASAADPALAIRDQPVNRVAVQELARSRAAEGDGAGAVDLLDVATQLYPTLPWVWRDRARLARLLGDEATARSAWSRMLALDLPERRDPLPYVREAIFGAGSDVPIEVARAILPDRADRWRQAARVFARLDMRADAELLFRVAADKDPSGVSQFGSALLRWGRPDEALALVEEPGRDCSRRRVQAQALQDLHRYDESLVAFQGALNGCGQRDWPLRAGLGRARLGVEDERGVALVTRLLEERPGAHGLRRALIRFLVAHGRPSNAAPHLEHLVLAGVASDNEAIAYRRATQGLPVRLDQLVGNSR